MKSLESDEITERGADAPKLTGELAALEAIAGQADAQLAGVELAAPGDAARAPVDRGAEFAGMLQMGVMLLTPVLPFMPQCYPESTCEQIGIAFAAVADKHGWNLDALSSPELALAVVALPPTIQAVMLGRVYFAQQRAAADAAQRAPGAEPLPQISG
jgi:hypothetical protein